MHFPSQPRTLILTERKPHIARLLPGDVAFLLEHHRGRVQVLPTGRRDRYRLTALGCAGVLSAPACRLVIRPKIPLANVFGMLDPLGEAPSESIRSGVATGWEAFDFLAGQLARRMAERVAVGLHRAYRECREQGSVLIGRLDLPAQLREAPGRKDQLHSEYEELSVDLPCNRVVKATTLALVASPLLSTEVHNALRNALAGFELVDTVPLSAQLWDTIEAERLPAEYRPLLDLCRWLGDSLIPNGAVGNTPVPSFLLDLERVFEMHVTRGVVEAFAQNPAYTIAVQLTRTVSESSADHPDVTMRPDLTIDRDGRTFLAIDAKWKRLPGNAETADLYQILAYGTALGAEAVVLIYPGRRWSIREYRFTNTRLRLMVCTLGVGGTRQACVRSVRRLGRALKELID